MSQTETIELYGIALEVDFDYTPPERGTRDSMGVPETPDFLAEIDIIQIFHRGEDIMALFGEKEINEARDKVLRKERD